MIRFLLPLFVLGSIASAEITGWRHDGTGHYPEAEPAVQWSTDQNVLWKTKLPDWGNGMPILAGNLVLLNVEPDTLVAVSAENGEVLWTASTPMEEALSPEQAEELARNQAEIEKLENEAHELNRQIRNQQRVFRAAEGEAKAKEEAKLDTLREKRQANLDRRGELGTVLPPTFHATGYTSPTAVSDGERVFVHYGTGVIAAYDLEGNRLWAKIHEQPRRNFGHSSSLRMVDGKLIAHILSLFALDPDTGEVLWTTGTPGGWGTAAVGEIDGTPILVTPKGAIVRAEDGHILASGLFGLPYSSPIIHDGVIYAVDQNGGLALQLPDQIEGDTIEVTELWKNDALKDRHYASPIVIDGILYAINRTRTLSAVDAETGKLLHQQQYDLGRGQQLYSSLSQAGDHLFFNHDNGTTAVLKPHTFELVSVNELEPTRSTPVFDGKRIYFRTDGHLYCLGSN